MRIDAERIVVIGTSCSGKTTFSTELAQRMGLPHIELDALHWGENWTPRTDFVARVERAVREDAWVIEGNYRVVRELTWSRADLIIWLDYPMGVVVGRALRRTLGRSLNGTMLWSGNRESLRRAFLSRDSILLWVLTTWRRRRHEFARLFAPGGAFAEKRMIRLRAPASATELLAANRLPTG